MLKEPGNPADDRGSLTAQSKKYTASSENSPRGEGPGRRHLIQRGSEHSPSIQYSAAARVGRPPVVLPDQGVRKDFGILRNVGRKLRKLRRNPRAFFADSEIVAFKWIGSRVPAPRENKRLSKTGRPKKAKPSKRKSARGLGLAQAEFTTCPVLRDHITKCLERCGYDLRWGDYRMDRNAMVLKRDVAVEVLTFEAQEHWTDAGFWIPMKGLLLVKENEGELARAINTAHFELIDDHLSLFSRAQELGAPRTEIVLYGLRAGVYTPELLEEARYLMRAGAFKRNRIPTVFGKLYRVFGADRCLEPIANDLARKIDEYPVAFAMRMAAFFCEAGDHRRAIDTAQRARSRDETAWEKHRFLGLSYLFHAEGLVLAPWAQSDHDRFLSLRRAEAEFEDLLRQKSMHFVGNGPTEIGKGRGPEIDASDYVVRFNGANTDFAYRADYGAKTDVLVLNPRYYETARCTKRDLAFIVVSDGSLYATVNLGQKIHDLGPQAAQVTLFPRSVDLELTQRLHASPSSGLKMLYWAYKASGPIPRDALSGFSMTDQGYGVSTSYSAKRRVGLPTIHNWQQERQFLQRLVQEETP